jgi:tetratricopeptide (TPR) repeat protein
MPKHRGFEAAVAEGLARFTVDRARVEELMKELGEVPSLELRRFVHRVTPKEPLAVIAALLRLAKSTEDSNPRRTTALARLLLYAVQRSPLLARTKQALFAEAESLIGASWRRQGKLNDAERAFRRVARHLDEARDPHLTAHYCALLADLRQDQGRPEETLALLARAALLFEEVGQTEEQALALVAKARLELRRDGLETALADLRATISLVDQGLSPALAANTIVVYGTIFRDWRRSAEALVVVGAFRERYPDFEDASLLADLDLLEGSLLIFSDRVEVAEARLEAARRQFLAAGEHRKAALACMNLAVLFLVDGRRQPDLRVLAEESIEPLSHLLPDPKIRESLRAFCAAIEDATAPLAGALRDDIANMPEEHPDKESAWTMKKSSELAQRTNSPRRP